MTFLRRVVTVMQGTAGAQAIGIAVLPILTRLYSPAAFGVYQFYQAVLVFFMVVAALRYEIAILEAKTEAQAEALLRLALSLNVVVALAVLAGSLVAITLGVSTPGGPVAMLLLPAVALLAGFFQTLSYLLLKHEDFRRGAIAKVTQVGGYAAAAIAIGSVWANQLGLVVGDLVGRVLSLWPLWRSRRLNRPTPAVVVDRQALREVARRFRDYPLFSLPAALLNAAALMLTPLLLFSRFDATTAGHFALVERGIGAPLALVSQAVAQVFLAAFAKSLREDAGHSRARFVEVVGTCAKLAIVPCIVIAVAAPWLVTLVFGPEWQAAGEFARIMSPLFFCSFVAAPATMLLTVLGQQRLQLVWDACRFAGIAIAWALVFELDLTDRTAIALHTAIGCVAYVACVGLVWRAITRRQDDQARSADRKPA